MPTTRVTRQIAAPLEAVFAAVAHIENFEKAIPNITRVDFLSEARQGVGTRFRETRRMGKKEISHELEVTEYVENDRVRIVTESHGTVWDTLFSVAREGEQTRLDLVMEARATALVPKLLNPLFAPLVKKAVAGDMDLLKTYCEKNAS